MRPTKNIKILIIDNDPRELESKVVQFYNSGYEVEVSESARLAKRSLLRDQPDYIITDLMMPVENGDTLRDYINIKYPEIPCFIASAWESYELSKPYNVSDFEELAGIKARHCA